MCVPLTAPVAAPTTGPGPPFGILIVAYSEQADPEAANKCMRLAHAISSHSSEIIKQQADTVLTALLHSPSHTAAEVDARLHQDTDDGWSSDDAEDLEEDLHCAIRPDTSEAVLATVDEASGSGLGSRSSGELMLAAIPPPCRANLEDSSLDAAHAASPPSPPPSGSLFRRLGSVLAAIPNTHPVWLTFDDPALEKGFVEWSAAHMAALDHASLFIILGNMLTLGFMPHFAIASRHPVWFLLGFLPVLPLAFRLRPSTRSTYSKNREHVLLYVHVVSAIWQQATRNSTLVLGTRLFRTRTMPRACFSWQVLNLLMFQLRWKWMVPICAIFLLVNCGTLLSPLCEEWGPVAGGNCVAVVATHCTCMLAVALVVLRMSELRMRRLYLKRRSRESTAPLETKCC